MSPYEVLYEQLIQLPKRERRLLSGIRRARMSWGPCGCFFGTIAPKEIRDGRSEWAYYDASRWGSPFRDWLQELVGECDSDIPALVFELEQRNDGFMRGVNDLETCEKRYRHMIDYLNLRIQETSG